MQTTPTYRSTKALYPKFKKVRGNNKGRRGRNVLRKYHQTWKCAEYNSLKKLSLIIKEKWNRWNVIVFMSQENYPWSETSWNWYGSAKNDICHRSVVLGSIHRYRPRRTHWRNQKSSSPAVAGEKLGFARRHERWSTHTRNLTSTMPRKIWYTAKLKEYELNMIC